MNLEWIATQWRNISHVHTLLQNNKSALKTQMETCFTVSLASGHFEAWQLPKVISLCNQAFANTIIWITTTNTLHILNKHNWINWSCLGHPLGSKSILHRMMRREKRTSVVSFHLAFSSLQCKHQHGNIAAFQKQLILRYLYSQIF